MQRFNLAPKVALGAVFLLGVTACTSETQPRVEETAANLSVPMVYDLDFEVDGTRLTGDLSVLNATAVTTGKVANMNVSLVYSGKSQDLDVNLMHCDAENNLTAHVSNENGVNNILTWYSSSLTEEIIAKDSFPCKNGDFTVVNPELTAEVIAKWATLPYEDWELQPEE